MSFDLSSPRLVLAGTAYGECRGGGRIGMENILCVVLNRWHAGWQSTPLCVCLAPRQFSCWDDANRAAIVSAALRDEASWETALQVADQALAGTLPMRPLDADSYFALSMVRPAYWARPPARHVYSDCWHSFWRVRAAVPGNDDSDALNDAELQTIQKENA